MIALLTDFGLTDIYVGVMKAIILTIAPGTDVVDLTHAIPPQDIAAGAWALACAWPYLPGNTVVVGVIDPGVGTARRPIAARLGSRFFVGPDNGLLTRILSNEAVAEAVVPDVSSFWLENREEHRMSATFHGRDLFAPVAARLAHGIPLAALGTPIDAATLVCFPLTVPARVGNEITAHLIHIDHFGNLITDIGPALTGDLFAAPRIDATLGVHHIRTRARTFGQGPSNAPFWYLDSCGHAAIAWRNDSAARHMNATVGMPVQIWLVEGP